VLGAGLIDGLNPCAFATIVFFVSYLSLSGRKGRELLLVGAAFTLGVFLTYLGVGLGLSALAQAVDFMSTFGRWVYAITAIICLVLAGVSIADYIKARRGEAGDMALSLPTALRKRINAVIRKGQSARAFVLVAFVTGIVISVIEFACTGQVYLPTIIFVLGDPELGSRATLYLLLYNIAFVLPLIAVFALAYFGTTSEQFGVVLRKHAAKVKLATVFLFLALAAWLIYALLA
jgi:cytochrome c biogenesis protein CcdA